MEQQGAASFAREWRCGQAACQCPTPEVAALCPHAITEQNAEKRGSAPATATPQTAGAEINAELLSALEDLCSWFDDKPHHSGQATMIRRPSWAAVAAARAAIAKATGN